MSERTNDQPRERRSATTPRYATSEPPPPPSGSVEVSFTVTVEIEDYAQALGVSLKEAEADLLARVTATLDTLTATLAKGLGDYQPFTIGTSGPSVT